MSSLEREKAGGRLRSAFATEGTQETLLGMQVTEQREES